MRGGEHRNPTLLEMSKMEIFQVAKTVEQNEDQRNMAETGEEHMVRQVNIKCLLLQVLLCFIFWLL